MNVSIVEQETTINFSRNDGKLNLWTSDTTMITKLDKKYPRHKEFTDKDGELFAVEYLVDKSLLSFRSIGNKRKVSEKSIKALAEARKKKMGV